MIILSRLSSAHDEDYGVTARMRLMSRMVVAPHGHYLQSMVIHGQTCAKEDSLLQHEPGQRSTPKDERPGNHANKNPNLKPRRWTLAQRSPKMRSGRKSTGHEFLNSAQPKGESKFRKKGRGRNTHVRGRTPTALHPPEDPMYTT